LRILITNRVLLRGSGTETVVRDLAVGLRRLGHEPMIYTPVAGAVGDQVRAQGLAVFTDIREVNPVPDIIHGQHHAETLTALTRFPDTRAIFVCHDATAWHDDPLLFPRVLRYVAVDHRCLKRLEANGKIPSQNIRVLLNAVDLSRFKPRSPLPAKPRRAAIFSNYASQHTHTGAVMKACQSLGIALDVIGKASNTATAKPEAVLPAYDLVFAKARCALESMAVGSAVVLCDFAGLGAMVRRANFSEFRKLNFGAGTLVRPLDPQLIAAEIQNYDAQESTLVSELARTQANLNDAALEWVELYNEVLAEHGIRDERAAEIRHSAELAAIAEYLVKWGYDARVEMEKQQIRKLVHWPILGRCVNWAVERERVRMLKAKS
jgi:hypothetical protein